MSSGKSWSIVRAGFSCKPLKDKVIN